jgi:hypothetical protein
MCILVIVVTGSISVRRTFVALSGSMEFYNKLKLKLILALTWIMRIWTGSKLYKYFPFNIMAECDFSERGSKIPGQEVVKVPAIEYIHHAEQLCKFELKINKVKK